MKRIESLQFVRAIACLTVLFTHILQMSNYRPFGNYFISGGYGVDLFFMLSGFLIYTSTKDGGNYKEFAVKRFFRIYPLYWVVFFCFSLFGAICLSKNYTFKYLFQNFLMLPWSASLTTRSLVVGVAWSTVFELYFYFVICLFLFLKIEKKYVIFTLLLIPLLLKINRSLSVVEMPSSSDFIISIIGSIKIIPFIIGALIGHFNQKNLKLVDYILFEIRIYLFAFFNLFFVIISCTEYYPFKSFLTCFLLFLTWLYIDNIIKINYNSFISRFLLKIGDISFSIYLIHTLVILILIDFFFVSNIFYLTFFSYFISVSLSFITYKYIEMPFMNYAKNFVMSKKLKKREHIL